MNDHFSVFVIERVDVNTSVQRNIRTFVAPTICPYGFVQMYSDVSSTFQINFHMVI